MSCRTAAVVVTFNGLKLLWANLESLQRQSLPFASVIVVDNGSDDGTGNSLRQRGGVEVVSSAQNRGFAGGANLGIRAALKDPSVDAVALINNDVTLETAWHEQARAALWSQASYGSCATCLLKAEEPERVDTAGICWAKPGFADNDRTGQSPPTLDAPPREVFGACAAAALYRRVFFESVGLFDESLFAYQEDVDLALRGQLAGWGCVFAPAARGTHRGFASGRRFPLGGTYADYYNARNRLHVLVKSLPGAAWKKHWKEIVKTHLCLALRSFPERRGGAVVWGMLHALLRLSRVFRARKRLFSSGAEGRAKQIEGTTHWVSGRRSVL